MTVLSDNCTSACRGGGEFANDDVVMITNNQSSMASVLISTNTIEQAALYYSPLLTAATSYSVLENQDNMIALDEGSNISATTSHNHVVDDYSMLVDYQEDDEYTQHPNSSNGHHNNHHEFPTFIKEDASTTSPSKQGFHSIMQNGAINPKENFNRSCSTFSLNGADTNCSTVYKDQSAIHASTSINKLCMVGVMDASSLTNVSTKNDLFVPLKTFPNNTIATTFPQQQQINHHSTHSSLNSVADQQEEQISNEGTLSSLISKEPFKYQPFLNNQFSLPDQKHEHGLENPNDPPVNNNTINNGPVIGFINNSSINQKKHHNNHDTTEANNNCYSQQVSCAPQVATDKHHSKTEEDPICILDSHPTTTTTTISINTVSIEQTKTNNNMGNTIINHYFPNEVHPLGFIEMVPNCHYQQQQQQYNNKRLSSTFHHHQYAVNYDHHQMVNCQPLKEMMELDEKNMTTTLTHSSSHTSLTHLSRFNGDVHKISTTRNSDEPSLTDLPFEMILHIITFIPHQDDWCHEYNTYWNIREKYLKKLHTEAKQSVHNQFMKKRFVKNLIEIAKPNPSRVSISSRDGMDDEFQYMSQTKYGIFSICLVNNHMYNNYFKNVHFWKLICETYFHIPRTDSLEPPVDKKTLTAIYSKEMNGNDSPTSKIAKLGDWLQGMLNISNASEFSNLAIDENMGSFQVTGAVQNSGSNANFFISTPPVQEELVWWQYSYHYLHSVPARFDLNPNCLLPIFQVSPKNASNEDPNMLNISGLAKENDITKNSVLYNTCISRLTETDNKKSPNDYRWRNATSEQIFTPNNLYYFEFYVEKIGGINLGVGIVPNIHFTGSDSTDAPKDFNPAHYDNFIWPSGSCHHCFEINNQRYYSGDVVGMLVDYSYTEKNVLKIHFCHNWHTKEKRNTLQNQLKKVADFETYCQGTGNFEQNVFSSLLEDEINNMKNGVKSKDSDNEDDINYPFKDNQIRLIYFTDDTQTQFPECVISEGRNELISFMKVHSPNNSSSTQDKKKMDQSKKWDLQKERPCASQKELTLPDFKLCVTTYDKEDSVRIIKPTSPHPPLYYHLLNKGRYNQQKEPAKPILSSSEEKELRKIIMDALGDCQYSKCSSVVNHSSSLSSSSTSSNEERVKGCSIM